VARSGEEIQRALRSFVGRWREYTGSERAEAQTFLTSCSRRTAATGN